MTGDGASQNRRPPRLNHKKSRAGCQRCKARRVKCDEAKPACGGCSRHHVPCIYLTNESPRAASTEVSLSPHALPQTDQVQLKTAINQVLTPPTNNDPVTADDILDLPESRQRRMLELRLWHNYVTVVATPFHTQAPISALIQIWNNHMPHIAMRHDNLLNTIYAFSATNLLRDAPDDEQLLTAQRIYLSLALREQRAAVIKFHTQAEEPDSLCFTSIMMTMNAFGSLQERTRQPYKPPTDMLRLGIGACAMFEEALKSARKFPASKIVTFIENQPFFCSIPRMFDEEHRGPFVGILGPRNAQGVYEDSELWNAEVREAYEYTLSYIGTMYTAVLNEESLHQICTRICAFTLYVPKKFVDMVEELRPRALVILAHFFSLATKGSAHWWVGQTPMREVQGLRRIVPLEWQRHLRWPLVMSGLEPV
ncbi:hypothetical protein AUEXF2481DRAFT_9029 [Aureobasidium subglaciale EXF-2481]|uniref:Zn(2)-C6 fungal-type domain-containing protein n=1 Tax=Aureobasidium subglaciale (strain EXF-2481) TaxID=1043005 RepID=A0A074Y9N7_AURSE|nr:uncharacterized protein AUEXF2481DRAFT_9029 [Aureobasidium subglaciale EXF-2481]KAI5205238.1 hypothetical protein E4T38_04387 [Aureobasidium subglaciale]KAI5224089.1 hypothetical protein E4T40_04163 [Aureobasidium subglaciale]KAI5228274.1 hypothetical protein E4T41_03924 [Aureobasidium subglaciale]KAI5262851.1 hypothetical protein E4T46_04131 [Aureobasidium subglaciale]KEQ90907.1 hypothetical protein AUEXF2481DRAFT_9029 [Aureobasidium subglaciale EXF-2481]